MEFFQKGNTVTLRSHLRKYLFAEEDGAKVRQSSNNSSSKARWTVESVEGKDHVIRLKSCYGGYLTASETPFLLGMTGKHVIQSQPSSKWDTSMEWEPQREGSQVKLRSWSGTYLRANGGTPPWRDSITHDVPQVSSTQNWVFWDVAVVNNTRAESFADYHSRASSFSSCVSDEQMELFQKGNTITLRSHLKKYLFAEEDGVKVRQSGNVSSSKARWKVESVEGKDHVIRLKSCYGGYLTASETPFLLGMTGKHVIQSQPSSKWDTSMEWEPQKEGSQVKLRSWKGTYLRANGGTPPWRSSITHDVPQASSTQNWVFWDVEVVNNTQAESFADYQSTSSFSSSVSDEPGLQDSEPNSPRSSASSKSFKFSFSRTSSDKSKSHRESFSSESGMELFHNAKAVRLRSYHEKYLLADEDEESVCQKTNGASPNAKWTVEFLEDPNWIRLKSRYGKYLTASNVSFLLGMTGRKVLQTLPQKLDSSVEWEPIREGFQVKLKTRQGNYLRANGGLPPWRNSVTHDTPNLINSTQDWLLWDVDTVQIKIDDEQEGADTASVRSSNMESDGRTIYYNIADEHGNVQNDIEGQRLIFNGKSVDELTQKLEKVTRLQHINVCSRNILNGKLYPLRMHLPPNNSTMHVVVIPASSKDHLRAGSATTSARPSQADIEREAGTEWGRGHIDRLEDLEDDDDEDSADEGANSYTQRDELSQMKEAIQASMASFELEKQSQGKLGTEVDRQRQKDLEIVVEIQRQRQAELELEAERKRWEEVELEVERQRKAELELEAERKRREELELEVERQRQTRLMIEAQRQRKRQAELEMEAERQRQAELVKEAERERQRQVELEMEAERQRHAELVKEAERERQRLVELEMEAERQRQAKLVREAERQRQRQVEREMEAERQRQRQVEREMEAERQRQRQLDLEMEAERQRQAELELEATRERRSEFDQPGVPEYDEDGEMEKAIQASIATFEAEKRREAELEREAERQREVERQRQAQIEIEASRERRQQLVDRSGDPEYDELIQMEEAIQASIAAFEADEARRRAAYGSIGQSHTARRDVRRPF